MTIAVLEPNISFMLRLSARLQRMLCGEGKVFSFSDVEAFTLYIREHSVDMVFVQADATDWRVLQRRLRIGNPSAQFVLVAGSDVYALDAIRAHVHDYLVYPIDDKQLIRAFTEVPAYEALARRKQKD